ncbi:hypothetical protein [Streptococcus suis]|nr:hypothetical protein [Streptococcus suis]
MNKRIKKKWSRIEKLENKVAQLTAENILLTEAVKRHTGLIEELNSINSRNAEAINSRFDAIETYRKVLEDEVKELKKTKKKGFFSRK